MSVNLKTVFESASGTSNSIGLRNYMVRVYQFMSLALGISGITAFTASSIPGLMRTIHSGPFSLFLMLAPLGVVFYFGAKIHSISFEKARNLFLGFAVLMGLSLSYIFLVYTHASIARAFFISSSVFLSMSIYGYSTKKDLTSMGSFMIMGLWGIIIASLINILFKSSAVNFAISILTVIVFVGLTAYDTQKIKHFYLENEYNSSLDSSTAMKVSLMGSLMLYMDFINLFLAILRLFGAMRNED